MDQLVIQTTTPSAGRHVVTLRGELDLHVGDELWVQLDELIQNGVVVVLDTAAVTFLDSIGLRVLLQARGAAAQCDSAFRLASPSASVVQVLNAAGVLDLSAVFPDTETALAPADPRPDLAALVHRPRCEGLIQARRGIRRGDGTEPQAGGQRRGWDAVTTMSTGGAEPVRAGQPDPECTRPLPATVVPRWCGLLLLVLGLLTLPWIAGLAVVLPSSERSAHYDVSWAGFDLLLCVLLLRTGWDALKRNEQSELTAAMAGTMLVVDAWFDVLSAPDTGKFLIALAMAVCVELPLAGLCLWICGRVDTERRRRETLLRTALSRAALLRTQRLGTPLRRLDAYRARRAK